MGAQITLDGLASVCTAATRDQLAPFIAPLQAAFDEPDFGLITWRARAAFLANAAHESQQFTRLEENLNYSAVGLLKTWPTRFNPAQAESMAKQPERIANYVYAKRGGNGDEASGDGWRFRGRGIF